MSSSWPQTESLLKKRTLHVPVTWGLVVLNVLIFVAMLSNGAGLWHSRNEIQLAWGANFGPATQDGEWWRLGTAMFLHFGVIHLALNMVALADGGKLVERMYGSGRFLLVYILSGLSGNLLSLVMQGNLAVSGGASGAIFGIYGALLVFLWCERKHLDGYEFRWLFWGVVGFSCAMILMGALIPAIDNAAHVGGFMTGILLGVVVYRPVRGTLPVAYRAGVLLVLALLVSVLITRIPAPAYKWRDELLLRHEINDFLMEDQALNREWLNIMHETRQGNVTYYELAGRIENVIADRYEESYEQLMQLPADPTMPSAARLESVLEYAQQKRDSTRALANELRLKGVAPAKPVPEAP